MPKSTGTYINAPAWMFTEHLPEPKPQQTPDDHRRRRIPSADSTCQRTIPKKSAENLGRQ
jgi:hypothetical protein